MAKDKRNSRENNNWLYAALGGATLTGAALTWANWLLGIGAHL